MDFKHQLYILIALNALSAVLILTALMTHKLDSFSLKYRVSIMLLGIGCIGQLALSLQSLSYWSSAYDGNLLYFILKDTGLAVWFTLAFYDIQIKNLCLKFYSRKDSQQHV